MLINLGGTCGGNNWRNELIPLLDSRIEYIDPVVDNWEYNEEVKIEKQRRMKMCDILLYVITPAQTGFSAIASAVDYSNKFPNKLIFCVLYEYDNKKFTGHMLESIKVVYDIIKDNGCKNFNNLEDVALYLNSLVKNKE